ncbi:MAG: hypothetical protein Kow0060_07730 [Methylohalobius crimeensis]
MRSVNIKETRTNLKQLLDAVLEGEEVVVCRHGEPIAKLVRVGKSSRFRDRTDFRSRIQSARTATVEVLRTLRDEEN